MHNRETIIQTATNFYEDLYKIRDEEGGKQVVEKVEIDEEEFPEFL